jgi:hypothetical protein
VWLNEGQDYYIPFFSEVAVTGDIYLGMLEQFMYTRVVDLKLIIIYNRMPPPPPPPPGICLFENFSVPSQIVGLGVMNQFLGHLVHQMSLWISL